MEKLGRGAPEPEDGAGPGSGSGCVLHLRLQAVRPGGNRRKAISRKRRRPTLCPGNFAPHQRAVTGPYHAYQVCVCTHRCTTAGQGFSGWEATKALSQRRLWPTWIPQASEPWRRKPVYDALHRSFCRETVLHGDETTLQVLKEPGRTSTSKSYMGLPPDQRLAEYPFVLYEVPAQPEGGYARLPHKDFSGCTRTRLPGLPQAAGEHPGGVGNWAHAGENLM